LAGATLDVAVADAGYTDTRTLTITAGTTQTQQNSIPIAAGTGSGEHTTTITLALPGGATAVKIVPCLVSQSITEIVPATGSKDVPVRAAILVRLSESVDPASITADIATLTANGTTVPASVSVTGDGSALVFKSNDKLTYATNYIFSVKAFARKQTGGSTVIDLTSTFSTTDMVGYWPMDGDWKDYSGSGNNAVAYGSATFDNGRESGILSGNFIIDSQIYTG